MGQGDVIAENKLQVVKCDVGFFIKTKGAKRGCFPCKSLSKGAAMVAKFGILAL